jgi:hypothetical protein
MIKLILVLLVVGFLFLPMPMVLGIFDNLSFSVFGILLWGLIILGLLFFLLFLPRNKKKTIGKKSTNKKIMEGVVIAAVARKLYKKPELSFDDSSVHIVKDPKGIGGESIYPVGLQKWEYIVSGSQGGREVTQKNRINRNVSSGNFGFYGKNIHFTAKWVEFSLDDIPDKYRKLFEGYLQT